MPKGKIKESRLLGGWKKKQWFTILAPKSFNERVVGETPAFNPEKIIGRTCLVNLMSLTGNMRKQNMNVSLEINKVVGSKANTFLRSYEIIPAYIRRIVRRGRNRLDETIKCKTSDKKDAIIKLFMMTINLAKSSQLKMLRREARKFVIEEAKKVPFEILLLNIISGKIQKDLKMGLKKIFPLKSVEVLKAELVKARDIYGRVKVAEVKVEEAPKEEAKPEEKPKEEKKAEKPKKPAKEKKETSKEE